MSFVLRRHPLVKAMLAYSVTTVAADINDQTFFCGKDHPYDKYKTLRIGIVGVFVIAPLVFGWVRLAERLFPGKQTIQVLKKLACDQAFFAPVAISSFYISTNVLERKSDLFEEWRMKFIPTWKTGVMFWPIVQSINFKFISRDYRAVFTSCCSFIWTTYLCHMKDIEVPHEVVQETKPRKDPNVAAVEGKIL